MENQVFWCIVTYVGSTPMYYAGYFKAHYGEPLKPVISVSFDDALKCHSKEAAQKILNNLNVSGWKVEDHMYM